MFKKYIKLLYMSHSIIRMKKSKNRCKKQEKEIKELSELHKEYNDQIETAIKWAEYMDSNGLSRMENFNMLPVYKPTITEEMLNYDYGKPKEHRWKKGERLPFKGDIVQPTSFLEKDEEAPKKITN